MRKISSVFVKITFLSLILLSCKNNVEPVLDFSKSELGILYSENLIMQNAKEAEKYFDKLGKIYRSNVDEKELFASLDDDKLKLEIKYETRYDDILSQKIEYRFIFDDSYDISSLEQDIKGILEGKYNSNGYHKQKSYLKYTLNVTKTSLTLSFEYDSQLESELYNQLDNYLSKVKFDSEFTLTRFEGTQTVPEDEIWILTELHRCSIKSEFKSSRMDLKQGKMLQCDVEHRGGSFPKYFDLIINNECTELNGQLLSDGPLMRYSAWDIQVTYDDPSIYEKIRLNDKSVLFPGMLVCVNKQYRQSIRLNVGVIKIKASNPIGKYLGYMNNFEFDKTSQAYMNFIGFSRWKN
jgi:hypothetical protein